MADGHINDKINVGDIPENEVESYLERIKKMLKNESL
jgi:hypothetical protein